MQLAFSTLNCDDLLQQAGQIGLLDFFGIFGNASHRGQNTEISSC
jgi:hypothetical protein